MKFLEKVQRAENLIKTSIEKYPNIIVGCSFGKDSMVTLHLATKIKPDIPIFAVLAETEFPETFAFKDMIVDQWNLNYKEYIFKQPIEFEKDLSLCCGAPKVEKTKEALRGFDAWISGVRKTEGITRVDFNYVEEKNGLVKINPILDFTEIDIWRYTALNNIPVNPMYAKGFRSLGCRYCSFPEEDENEPERAGRWKGTSKAQGECGIHTQSLR